MRQLLLFPMDAPDPTEHTPNPLTLLRNGAALVLSVSGGKDSDAVSHHLLDLRQSEGWPGEVMMVHADLGRAEWQQTPDYVRDLARRKGVPLHVVRWTHGDLIDRIWQRYLAEVSNLESHVPCGWCPSINSLDYFCPVAHAVHISVASGHARTAHTPLSVQFHIRRIILSAKSPADNQRARIPGEYQSRRSSKTLSAFA